MPKINLNEKTTTTKLQRGNSSIDTSVAPAIGTNMKNNSFSELFFHPNKTNQSKNFHLSSDYRENLANKIGQLHGNSALQRLIQTDGKNKQQLPKNIHLTIAADKQAEWWTPEWYDDFNVGHSWVMITMADGQKDSYGFWPANLGRGGGFNPKQPWVDIAGEVRHPDTAHSPTATKTLAIDNQQLKAGIKYATAHAKDNYNLLTYNCTTFARAMFEEATGQSSPYAGLIIDDPNDLAASIEEHNQARGLDRTENPIPKKNSSSRRGASGNY